MKGPARVSLKKVELFSYVNTFFFSVNITLDSLVSKKSLRPIVEVGYQWLEWEIELETNAPVKHSVMLKSLISLGILCYP